MWLKLLAGAGSLAFAVFLILAYGNAREAQGRLTEQVAAAKRQALADRKAGDAALEAERRVTAAVDGYAARAAALRPIVLTNTKEVMTYAATPAGAALCRAAERVRLVDGLDAALFPPAAPVSADGRTAAVPADATGAPAGR
ncbi:hypothetical protein [Sphingomonas beigongshangi]|uniref:hypothetical protein n=1 Tax=Sphingomonas beigongshangi TaxID=2782540 RepID=UPI00193AEEE6|nr:hypothetical protein [Sphingomonas beigongshangi]